MKTIVPWNSKHIALDWLDIILWASPITQWWRIHLPIQEIKVQSLVREEPLEGEMTIHSSILAWEIPWTEEPGGLRSTMSQRVEHDSNWTTTVNIILDWLKKGFFLFFHNILWTNPNEILTNPIFPCVSTAEKNLGLNIFIWPSNHTLHPLLYPSALSEAG